MAEEGILSAGDAFERAFASIGDCSKSAKEMFGDFADSIFQDSMQ